MAAYAAVVSLKKKVLRILNKVDVLLAPLARETFEFLAKEMKSFQIFLEILDSKRRKRMNSSLGRVAEAIRKFDQSLFYPKRGKIIFTECKDEAEFDVYLDDVRYIEGGARSLIEKLKKVKEEYYSLDDEAGVVVSSSPRVVSKSKIFGLCDQPRRLKEDVLDPWIHDTFYAVVGMAGIGKTGLAWDLFHDLDICEWFECRAAVNLGNYKLTSNEITKVILAQVNPEAHKRIMGGCEEDIGEVLKVSLKGKRYLIVIDDVWDEKIHDYVKSSFPDNQNGSRLLLTTRMKYIVKSRFLSYYVFDMRLLDEKESWDLLREKVFAGASCPPHLEKAGKKIAEKCDGLPLTIVTVADLLLKAEEPLESLWIDVAEMKKHQLFIDAYDQISQVLYPSYKRLNDETKSCFLYMGVFPLKFKISKTRLINLWFAEELIETYKDLTLESCAINTLLYLDLNCLIMVHQRATMCLLPLRVVANIKTCGLHSSWWHFCQREARETNFFYALDCYQDGVDLEDKESQSRLTVHNNVLFAIKDVHNSMEENCANTARSLLCLGPYNKYMVPICFGLKLLQRLDALNIRFYVFPLEVLELAKLRYLALTCNGNILPSSISKLEKLQYLIVQLDLSIKTLGGVQFYLPMEIWDMKEMQHLQVMGSDLPDLGETSLQKLLSLSGVTTSSFIIIKRASNLKKLGVRVELEPDAAQPLFCFNHISHLTKLESFKCVIVNPEYNNCKVISPFASFSCLPFSLNKLSFNGLGYPWEEMSKIASLPNLGVLKLRCNSFQGPMWKVEENGFPMLKSLLMEDLDLVKLEWARGSLKNLEALTIKHCYKLKELHLGDFQQVWEIQVVDSNPLIEWHVKYNTLTEVDVNNISVHSSWKS